MRSVSTGPVRPVARQRRLSASGSSIGSSMRRLPSRASDERADRFRLRREQDEIDGVDAERRGPVRSSNASSSGTISDERDCVRIEDIEFLCQLRSMEDRMRVEEEVVDNNLVIRAGCRGIDPDEDVDISVADDMLT